MIVKVKYLITFEVSCEDYGLKCYFYKNIESGVKDQFSLYNKQTLLKNGYYISQDSPNELLIG